MSGSDPVVRRIGEISAATGMTVRTLHDYEEIGERGDPSGNGEFWLHMESDEFGLRLAFSRRRRRGGRVR